MEVASKPRSPNRSRAASRIFSLPGSFGRSLALRGMPPHRIDRSVETPDIPPDSTVRSKRVEAESMTVINGKRVLLTGASSGIGEEAAKRLAARGARLALVARREERLHRVADEIARASHPRPEVIAADLGVRGTAAQVARRAVDALGPIDVLVNNAGASIQALTWLPGDGDEASSVFETNLWSPMALVAALAPDMVARGEGVIVNTGSMAQVSPFPHLGHYSASRAALGLITQAMRLE